MVLRVEAGGELLGEFPLDGAELVLRLQDGETGRVISTLTLSPGVGLQAPAPLPPLPPLPEPTAGRGIYQDKTVDLSVSGESTLAEGIERIREAARGGAPGVINFQLPAAPQPKPIARPEPVVPPPSDESESPTEDLSSLDEHEGTAEGPELGERSLADVDASARPLAAGAPLPPPEQDRSITRTLSNGMVDLIHSVEAGAHPGGDQLSEKRPTVTESLGNGLAGQPTNIKHASVDDPALADAGRPTRVGDDPGPPSRTFERVRPASPVVPTDFADEEDEPVTVVARSPHDDFTLGLPVDPGMVGAPGGYDEVPVPEQPRRGPQDDLSLSLPYEPAYTEGSVDDLSLSLAIEATASPPNDSSLSLSLSMPAEDSFAAADDDDLTLPLPEETSDSAAFDDLNSEATVTHEHRGLEVSGLGKPQMVPPRLLDTTAGFVRDPSTERLEGAEVWFRRHGEWTPRGALGLGQHVQAFGGMVRCDDAGGLVVLAGPRLHGSATLPSGELRQIHSGQQAVHLPAGTSIILWQGEQGIYVRSNVAVDTSGPVLDQGPVVYRRPPRSRAWKPPASDLEDT